MSMIDKYLEQRWSTLIEVVKDHFNEIDVGIDNGLCRDSWETFAWLLWSDSPQAVVYVDTANGYCSLVCEALSDFEVGTLLAWRWSDYLDIQEPDVDAPWDMTPALQREALTETLQAAVAQVATNDGQLVQNRLWSDDDAEEPDESVNEDAQN